MRKIQYYKSMGCLKKKIFVLFFSIAAFAFADENTIELSLEDAVKSALKNNVSIKQSEINLDEKKRESTYSWNSISPSISGTGRYSKNIPSSSDDKASLSAGISLNATLSPSVYTSAKNAELSYSQQQLSYQNDLRSVELDVRKNYYSLLYKIEEISLKEKSLETSKNQYESNLAKYKRGTLSRLDVLSAQVSYQNDQLELKSLNAEMENSIASFKQLVGLPQNAKISLSGSFENILNLKNISIEGMDLNSFSIESLQKQIDSAKNSLLASRFTAYGPSLSASYSYNYSSIDGGSNWDDNGTLSLQASIPLDGFLPWSSGSLNVQSKKDSVKSLELELEDAKVSLEVNISTLMNKINQCLENISLRKSSIELAQTTYEMTLESYSHGTKDLLSLQTASDNLLSAKVNLISEAYNLICAVLDLENAAGIPFGTLEN
ncbi:MAG TPA: hypothetical protein DD629_04060 [Treponema sp.]|nr:hypothetical protein [Treponema sp.]